MEIFGGMAVMAGILGFFLSVVWLVMPFVVFAIKGRVDRAVYLLEEMETRLKGLDERLAALEKRGQSTQATFEAGSVTSSDESP